MPGSHEGRWLEITVACPQGAAEIVADALMEHAPAGASFGSEGGLALVSVYLPDADAAADRVEAIGEAITRLGATSGEALSIRTRLIEEQEWAEAWKAHYHPIRVGRRLVIKPGWEPWPPEDGSQQAGPEDIVIELDPGMAFGTGGHATTTLCLEALEELVRPGMRVADIGCGSGILSIAAARLGAASVTATDIDPLAAEIARDNCSANAVEAGITVLTCSGLPAGPERYDVIVANISAPVIGIVLPLVADRLAAGGRFLLSGFTDRGVGDVCRSLSACGLELLERRGRDEWLAVIAGRRAGCDGC